ncbi:MAG: hypothetical protein EBU84_00680 [Actinobacteria bacterium]|jgi:hypothetical protein|nr:hypothetical protein [Actinomycetota bacterium]
MTLTDSQRKLLIKKIHEVWTGDRPCPICSKVTSWGISNISQMTEYNGGNYCPGALVCPLIRVTCDRCGYTILFSAIALGVVDPVTGKVKEAP